MDIEQLQLKMRAAANRLAKWRTILTGWQVGTKPKGDPEADAIRDHREATLLLRAEVSALTNLLLTKTDITHEEVLEAFIEEYEALDEEMSRRFPGAKSTDMGMSIDPQESQEWMSRFPD